MYVKKRQVCSNHWCKSISPLKIKKAALLFFVIAVVLPCAIAACRDTETEGDTQWHSDIAEYHRNADITPYELHYLDMGQGKPIFLIHGWADSVYTWHKNLPALAQPGFRLILVDLPGLGQSAIPPQPFIYSVENLSSAVMSLVDYLGLRRVAIVGHSMGGAIALHICLNHPRRVTRAVAVAPACYRPSHRTGRFLLKIPGVKTLASALAGRWTVSFALKEVFYNDDLVTTAMVTEYTRPFDQSGFVDVITSLALDFFSSAHTQMAQSYHQLETPLLIIWGDQDKWLPPAMGRRLHKQVRGSRLVILPQAGHNVHQEAHSGVNHLITNFLALDAYAKVTSENTNSRYSQRHYPDYQSGNLMSIRSGEYH